MTGPMTDEADPTVMGVAVDVYPDARDFPNRLRRQLDPETRRLGVDLGRRISAPIGTQISSAIHGGVRDGGRAATAQAARDGDNAGKSMGDRIRRRLQAALASLPDVRIDADSSQADRDIARLRREIESLSELNVDVDINDREAMARLQRLRNELSQLARDVAELRTQPGVEIDVDATRAMAEVTALKRELEEIRREAARPVRIPAPVRDGGGSLGGSGVGATGGDDAGASRVANLGTQASGATRHMHLLIAAGVALGPAIIPAAAAAGAAVAGVGIAAIGAGAGLGVAALAASGVSEAVQALGTYQQQAGQRAQAYAAAQMQIASAADGVRQAQAGVAAAVVAAGEAQERAARQVIDADRRVADAKDALRRAHLGVIEAQRMARREAEDLALSQRGGVLAERSAVLALERARISLNAVQGDRNATNMERAQAQLDYDLAEQRLAEQQVQNKRIAEEKARSDAQGINGSERVRDAQGEVASATRGVADAERAAADARVAQVRQARDGALSIAQAQQGVVAAQRSLQQATMSAANASRQGVEELRRAMDNLSPAGQRFARFLFSLSPLLRDLRFAAQETFLPGLQKAIEILLPYADPVIGFIGEIGTILGDLAVAGAEALTAPFWKDFFSFIAATAGPTLRGMAEAAGYVIKGFAALIMAFGPLSKDFGLGLVDMARRFAEWATTLSTSQGFQEFVGYVQEFAPIALGLFGDLVVVAFKLIVALAPLGGVMVTILGMVAEFLAGLDPGVLLYIAGAIAGIVAGLIVFAAGPVAAVTAIVVAVTAMVGVIIYAYQRVTWFRRAVDVTFAAIGAAALWLWRNAILPAWNGIVAATRAVWPHLLDGGRWVVAFVRDDLGPIFLWLWRNVIVPAWDGIVLAVGLAWDGIQIVFGFIRAAISNVIAPLFLWLWRSVIVPTWKGIELAIRVAWAAIQIIWGLVAIVIKTVLAPAFTWLWNNIVKPVWTGIGNTIRIVWETAIRPIFNALGGFIRDYVVPAFKTGVTAIGKAWDGVRDIAKIPIKFVVETVLNNGIIKAYNWLAKKFGVATVAPITVGFAAGGVLPGYTPGRDVHQFYSPTAGGLALSGGEGIIRPEATQALGAGWVHGINAAARTGGVAGARQFVGYAGGGILDVLGDAADRARKTAGDAISGVRDALFSNPADTIRRLVDKLITLVPNRAAGIGQIAVGAPKMLVPGVVDTVLRFFSLGDDGSSPGGRGGVGNQLGGSAGMMRILRAQFPGLGLISGYRPGSTTLTGNRSYHADDRAVDVGPNRAVARWIHDTWGRITRELITPFPEFNLLNGRPHRYTGAVWNQHNFAGGNAHDHWAAARGGIVPRWLFDDGGWLPKGLSVVENRTGRPEAVMNDRQWRAMQAGRETKAPQGRSNTYNIYPRRSTLDARELQAITDRQDMLDRVGRSG